MLQPKISLRMLVILFIAGCLASSPALAQDETANEAITFHASVADARDADASGKPVVIYFGADWCSNCRMMHDNTFTSPTFDEFAVDYLWVDVDIDDDPLTAAMYSAVGVPMLVVLNKDDVPVGKHAGFLSPDRLIAFVEDAIENPKLLPATVLDLMDSLNDHELSDEEAFTLTREIIESLADPERQDRIVILDALQDHRETLTPNLIVLMDDSELGIRAAAGQALAAIAPVSIRFDPFASVDIRRDQIQKIESDLR